MKLKEVYTDKGYRDSNLDLIHTFGTTDCIDLVLFFDGYNCTAEHIYLAACEIEKSYKENAYLDMTDILRFAKLKDLDVKACLIMLVKRDSQLHIFSSGDCRLYSLEYGLITTDHTEAWRKLELKGLTKNKIQKLVSYEKCRNILWQSIRTTGEMYGGDSRNIPLDKVSTLLFCSDGFWEHFESDTHKKLLTQELSLEDFAKSIHQRNTENMTACIIEI